MLQIAKAMVGALLGSRAPELFFSRKNRQHIKNCGEKQPFVHELGEKNTFAGAQRAPEKERGGGSPNPGFSVGRGGWFGKP